MSYKLRKSYGEFRIMSNQLLFICGALRSGTSLTHLILDQHSEIRNPGEFDFLFDQVSGDGIWPNIDEYKEWLSMHRIFQSKQLQIDPSLDYPDLINSFIAQLSKENSVLALNIHRKFDCIPSFFPNAKFIHLIRDPRDVARSSIGMGWAGNVFHGVDHWIETEKSWQDLQKRIEPEQFVELRFEELILSPVIVLQRICEFIGVPYMESMLNYADNSTYSSPDPSLVYQWKKKLSIKEIQYVELKAHDLMSSLGYALSEHPLLTIGFFERIWLGVTNKLFKLKYSIKRHGLLLFIKHRMSRLLRLNVVNRQAILQMNDNDKLHLK